MASTTWILIVIIRSTTPPIGAVVEGFATEADCLAEAANYCNDPQKFHCACKRNVREEM